MVPMNFWVNRFKYRFTCLKTSSIAYYKLSQICWVNSLFPSHVSNFLSFSVTGILSIASTFQCFRNMRLRAIFFYYFHIQLVLNIDIPFVVRHHLRPSFRSLNSNVIQVVFMREIHIVEGRCDGNLASFFVQDSVPSCYLYDIVPSLGLFWTTLVDIQLLS